MGKSKTFKFVIKATCVSFTNRRRETHTFGYNGKVSKEALKEWRTAMNASFDTHNSHLKHIQSPYSRVQLVEQKTGAVIYEYNPPMFEEI